MAERLTWDERIPRVLELVDRGASVSEVKSRLGLSWSKAADFMKPSARRFADLRARALRLRGDGLDIPSIAAELGVSKRTVGRVLRGEKSAAEDRAERNRKMAAMRDAGFSNVEIAACVGVTAVTVSRVLCPKPKSEVRPRMPVGRPPMKPEQRARILALLAEGRSLRKVAAEVGVSHTTVRRVRDRGGA